LFGIDFVFVVSKVAAYTTYPTLQKVGR